VISSNWPWWSRVLALLLTLGASSAHSEDALWVESLVARPGVRDTMTIGLTSAEPLSGLLIRLAVEGMPTATWEVVRTYRTESLSLHRQSDGTRLAMALVDTSGTGAIPPGRGPVLHLVFVTPERPGRYPVRVELSEASTDDRPPARTVLVATDGSVDVAGGTLSLGVGVATRGGVVDLPLRLDGHIGIAALQGTGSTTDGPAWFWWI